MSHGQTRDRKVIASVPCPVCGAVVGQWCYQQTRDGRQDAIASRVHSDRRTAWQLKRAEEIEAER